MLCMSKMAPLIAVIPISLLLTLSFFVLLSLDKAQTKKLKIFGKLVAVILWLAVLVIVLGGINRLAKGVDPRECMMRKDMKMRMGHGAMPAMPPEKMQGGHR